MAQDDAVALGMALDIAADRIEPGGDAGKQLDVQPLRDEVALLRALTYRAAELMLRGEDGTMLASMAKLKSGRLSREIADACLQYYGGMGYMNETNISRAYRDTRLGSIGGGADEIMLSIICKHMGILPGKRNR